MPIAAEMKVRIHIGLGVWDPQWPDDQGTLLPITRRRHTSTTLAPRGLGELRDRTLLAGILLIEIAREPFTSKLSF